MWNDLTIIIIMNKKMISRYQIKYKDVEKKIFFVSVVFFYACLVEVEWLVAYLQR